MPTYSHVRTGQSGHVECVRVELDASLALDDFLDKFLDEMVDTRDGDGQGANRGFQYRPAIFFASDAQRDAANAAVARVDAAHTVRVRPASEFHVAEDEHQKYYETRDLGTASGMPLWMGSILEDPLFDENALR